MQAYIARRLLAIIPTLLFASLIVFTMRLIPGDIIDLMLSSNDIGADKKSRAQLETALGLDQPTVSQYLRWLERDDSKFERIPLLRSSWHTRWAGR